MTKEETKLERERQREERGWGRGEKGTMGECRKA